MARKLRLEYPDALYHVINRGNYRRDVFESKGAVQSFVGTLEEAVCRHEWRLQAYVDMRNHFHLVLETPEPNLSTGMHWLLSTVATRFNRFRNERGHLFQGRYQALVIEDHLTAGHVVDYVHLNPVRAEVMAADELDRFEWSSLTRFLKGPRFPGLDPRGALEGRAWKDTKEVWAGYLAHLAEMSGNQEEQRRLGYEGFSFGWAIGSQGWRRAMAKEYASLSLVPGLSAGEARAFREARWEHTLGEQLRKKRRTLEEAMAAPKTERWKLEIAQAVRDRCGASVAWLAQGLNLGTHGTARSLLSKLRRPENQQYSA